MKIKRVKEAIDYGDETSRMHPEIEKQLGDPKGMFGQNPAFPGGSKDVEKMGGKRFRDLATELKTLSGKADLSNRQTLGLLLMDMSRALGLVKQIEDNHREELEELAVESAKYVTRNFGYQIVAKLSKPSSEGFKLGQPEKKQDPRTEKKQDPKTEIKQEFDLDNLTPEQKVELQTHRRNIANAVIHGTAALGSRVIAIPEIKSKLDRIDRRLYDNYRLIMAFNDYLYFIEHDMIEQMNQLGLGIGGKAQIKSADNTEENKQNKIELKIEATGYIFPILLLEIIKGIKEAHLAPRDNDSETEDMLNKEKLSDEPIQIRVGTEIVNKMKNLLPTELFDPFTPTTGLYDWFEIILFNKPVEEFFDIMRDVMSSDERVVNSRGKEKLMMVLEEAEDLSDQFEELLKQEQIDRNKLSERELQKKKYEFLDKLGLQHPSEN